MDTLIVWLIVAGAVVFTIRSFIRTYQGEGSCSCGQCTCSSKDAAGCRQSFPMDKTGSHLN